MSSFWNKHTNKIPKKITLFNALIFSLSNAEFYIYDFNIVTHIISNILYNMMYIFWLYNKYFYFFNTKIIKGFEESESGECLVIWIHNPIFATWNHCGSENLFNF